MFGIEENEWKENENGGKMEGGKTLKKIISESPFFLPFSINFP